MKPKAKSIIVLAMHGRTPSDFPQAEKAEYFRLQSQLTSSSAPNLELKRRRDALEQKIRVWRRTAENDPYHHASHELGKTLQASSGSEVIVSFNEFCAPSIPEAIDLAAEKNPEKILIVTPMMTKGSGHSDVEIPLIVKQAQAKHPACSILYVWPFDDSEIAAFLNRQINLFLKKQPISV